MAPSKPYDRNRPPNRGAPPPRGPAPTATSASGDELVYGLRAGIAVLTARPEDVRAVTCIEAARAEVLGAIEANAEGLGHLVRDRTFAVRPEHELERLVSTRQHEGLVVRARARRWLAPAELGDILARNKGTAIALDRVRNPYNIGAVLRSAAFFGVDAALLGAPAPHPALAPDAVRVAEGGVEHLLVSRTTDLVDTLTRLRLRGVQIVGADGAAEASAFGFAFRRPTLLVMGNEREGLAARVRAQCDAIVKIPGTGAVESLNVAVATGVLIAEMHRGATRATRATR
jgi:TrmH RNA methyltransferase